MKKINRISTASLVAAASLTFSPMAWSLGLGDVTVESFLNQPLQVKIDLISRETDDLASVSAKLASADDYELIGASRESMPYPIRFSVEDLEGDVYLQGTSDLPITSPIVRLIVEVNWSSGRLLREYTVFLDPPTFSEPAPIPRIDERKSPPPVSEPVAEPVERPAPASAQTPAAESADSPAATPREPLDGEYGPVASGETLWAIASNWSRGTGLEMNKVMIAIQRENPNAFLNGNINLLKRGAILRMPRVGDVESMSTAAAISEVSAQTEAFRGSSPAEPAASPATPLLAEEAAAFEPPMEVEQAGAEQAEAEESEVVEAESATTAEPASEAPVMQDQLELVPPSEESNLDSAYGFEESEESDADASLAVSALRENLARTEEDLITQEQQNEYLAERIKELEAQLAEVEEDKVADADLANMQNRLREERLADTAPAQDAKRPWYSRFSAWLIGLLVLAAGLVGWLLSRRSGGDQVVSTLGSEGEQLREIKDEAEDVLQILEEPDEKEAEDDGGEPPEQEAGEEVAIKQFDASGDDAEILDEESSDPEIQLDLARAYISMGDKEAARVILDEVGINGSEEQQEEAKKMLDLLVP